MFIVGTRGCVFIDNETHSSGVTKCTTGEAWSAFSWHHSSVFYFCSLYQMDWRNFMNQSVTVGAQLLWGGHNGCNNGRYGCTIVMSYIEINKALSQWLLTFNLRVSVTWPLTCAFHIPCTHTPDIIDMHRDMCDNNEDRIIIIIVSLSCIILHIIEMLPLVWVEANIMNPSTLVQPAQWEYIR